jgi:hypothetical protein
MSRLAVLLALGTTLFLIQPALHAQAEPVAATVVSLEGESRYDDDGTLKPVELGQLLGEGDRIVTLEGAGLHLVLADGSSLVLGPNTEVTLHALGSGAPGSKTLLQVLKGLINLMVEKQDPSSVFEVETANAIAAVKGTDFEVDADADNTQVTVNEGEVHLGDPERKRFEPIHPLEQASLRSGRLNHANRLEKREAGAFRERWQRAHMIHQQRHELLRSFRKDKAAKRRFKARHRHRQVWLKKHGEAGWKHRRKRDQEPNAN